MWGKVMNRLKLWKWKWENIINIFKSFTIELTPTPNKTASDDEDEVFGEPMNSEHYYAVAKTWCIIKFLPLPIVNDILSRIFRR